MRIADLTWPKAEEYFQNNDTLILTVGSIECHGRHLPLGTDTYIPERILELLDTRTNVAMAPVIPFGACDSQTDYPGTVSLGTDVLYAVLSRIAEGYRKFGVRRFAVLNGHGGNIPVLDRLSLDLHREGCLMVQLNWWLMAWDLNPAWKGGHGGAEETAGMLAVRPELVDASSIEDLVLKDPSDKIRSTGFKTVRFENVELPMTRPVRDITDNGWIGPDHPSLATREWGEDMLTSVADYIARFLEAFREIPLP